MKRIIAFAAFTMYCANSFAQSEEVCVMLKPGDDIGQDAYIWRLEGGCIPSGLGSTPEFVNFGTAQQIYYARNTWSPCGTGTARMVLQFDELATIPTFATITSAQLRIFSPPAPPPSTACCPSSTMGGSNAAWLRRITAPWDESTVTWSSISGARTAVGQIPVPSTGASAWGLSPAFNVTAMVQGFVTSPVTNNGFMFELQDEAILRRSAFFASSETPSPALRPQLLVCYTVDCETDFKYTFSSMPNQNLYTFEVMNPTAGYTYEWYIDEVSIGTGLTAIGEVPYSETETQVCLRGRNAEGVIRCEKCIDICSFGKSPTPYPPASWNCFGDAAFTVTMNTANPYEVEFKAVNPFLPYTYSWSGAGSYVGTPSGTSFTLHYTPVYFAENMSLNLMSGSTLICGSSTKFCFPPSGDLSDRPANDNIERYDGVIPPDAYYSEAVSLYPNPSSNGWNLQVLSELDGDRLEIELTDVSGRLVYSKLEPLQKGDNKLFIPGDDLPAAIYLVKLKSKAISTAEKVSKTQ